MVVLRPTSSRGQEHVALCCRFCVVSILKFALDFVQMYFLELSQEHSTGGAEGAHCRARMRLDFRTVIAFKQIIVFI